MRKYIKFLERMNDQLKLQILDWTRKLQPETTCLHQQCGHYNHAPNPLLEPGTITIVKPKNLYSDFEGALSENNYLKRMSSIQQEEIDRLRELRSAEREE